MKVYILFNDNGTRDTLRGIFTTAKKALTALQNDTVGWRDENLNGPKESWTLDDMKHVHPYPTIIEVELDALENIRFELHEWSAPTGYRELASDDPLFSEETNMKLKFKVRAMEPIYYEAIIEVEADSILEGKSEVRRILDDSETEIEWRDDNGGHGIQVDEAEIELIDPQDASSK